MLDLTRFWRNSPITFDANGLPQGVIDCIVELREIHPFIPVVQKKKLSELLDEQTSEAIKKQLQENTEWKK